MTGAGAFEVFVRQYQDMVFGTAVRLLGDAAEAEDVAQTVFMRAFERFDKLADSPSAGGWLKTVTTNACLNHLSRFRARWRLFSQLERRMDDAVPIDVTSRRPAFDAPDAALERAETHARLEEALHRLPPHQRIPLVLFHFQDRSYREIAALLGVSLSKVKTDMHRGREVLRRLLEALNASG